MPIDDGTTTGGGSSRYVGEKGAEYFTSMSGLFKIRASIAAELVRPFVRPEDDLLEFGCGPGELLCLLSARSKVGVDLNETALAEARRKGLEVYRCIAEIPAERQFDVAISNHCLEHVPYPIGALREIHRKLRPGGRLILSLPIDDWRIQRRYNPKDINHHLHTWTPLLLGHTLTEAGFDVGPMQIRTFTWPRRFARFQKMVPAALWSVLCYVGGVVRKQRSILAVARRPVSEGRDGRDGRDERDGVD
jgi:SAM-dependent methyltransferase